MPALINYYYNIFVRFIKHISCFKITGCTVRERVRQLELEVIRLKLKQAETDIIISKAIITEDLKPLGQLIEHDITERIHRSN